MALFTLRGMNAMLACVAVFTLANTCEGFSGFPPSTLGAGKAFKGERPALHAPLLAALAYQTMNVGRFSWGWT